MFHKRKGEEKPNPRGERKQRGNLPLIGYNDDDSDNDNDNDKELEKELAALMGSGSKSKSKPKQRKQVEVAPEDLDAMVASCMKDYNDDDLSDTDDPDLLAELEDFENDDEEEEEPASASSDGFSEGVSHSYLQTIKDRLALYKEAESVAKSNGDTSRARRFNRGVKTLQDLERRASAGHPIREDDIPPVVSVGKIKAETNPSDNHAETAASAHAPTSLITEAVPLDTSHPSPRSYPAVSSVPAPVPLSSNIAQAQIGQINNKMAEIQRAREDYKSKALAAKAAGDRETALEMMKYIKICDKLVEDIKQGNTVDLSLIRKQDESAHVPQEAPSAAHEVAVTQQQIQQHEAADQKNQGEDARQITILESLQERRNKYAEEEKKALDSENSSKARRMGRIRKQYEDAIKLHKLGRPIPRGDLPDPPGFQPIPATDPPKLKKPEKDSAKAPSPAPPVPASASSAPSSTVKKSPAGRQTSLMSVQEKQLSSLLKRQAMFKAAALQAKQQGQLDTAKEYLRQALSFNKLIEVSKGGLPVDMGTLPVPPQMQDNFLSVDPIVSVDDSKQENRFSCFSWCYKISCLKTNKVKTDMDFEIVAKEECTVMGDREEMYAKLEQDLISQVKMCMANRTYFKEVGDIASSNKFEQMALHAKKDLDAVRNSFKRGDPVPKFHYETRSFSRVVSNTDLSDNDLELSILNGINYVVKNPKEVDTYIKWEFPYPRDAPVSDKTAVIKDTNNPEYATIKTLVINPRDKSFQRVVKRSAVKLEVWSKGGFLRSDALLGTAVMKLAPLETSCTIHDSFDLYDGRKPVGGKVEAKIRIRNGIVAKQIEQKQEKWLVIQF